VAKLDCEDESPVTLDVSGNILFLLDIFKTLNWQSTFVCACINWHKVMLFLWTWHMMLLLLKFMALFRNIIHMICVAIPTHYMSLLCQTSDSLMTRDWEEKKFCCNRCIRDRRKSVFISSSLMGSLTQCQRVGGSQHFERLVSFKCWEPLAHWHIVTCQKSGILSNTAVRTSNCVCVSLVL